MPRLMIDLTGVEYDRLCEMARRERRTPQAQAAVVIGTTMAALAGEIALEPTDRSEAPGVRDMEDPEIVARLRDERARTTTG